MGRLSAVLGCRALTLLHDQDGHPRLSTTHRGDQHLTVGLPSIVARYEQQAGVLSVGRVIVDREGMAAEFLAALRAAGRTVISSCRPEWLPYRPIERAESGPESIAQRTKPSAEETLRHAAKLVEGCIPAGNPPITLCAEEPRSCDTVQYRETFAHALWKE